MTQWPTILLTTFACFCSVWTSAQTSWNVQKQCTSAGGNTSDGNSAIVVQQVWGQSSLTQSFSSDGFTGTQGFLSGGYAANGSGQAPSLMLYPNPGTDIIHIQWTGYEQEEVSWFITNLMGQELHRDSKQKDQNTNTVNMDLWAPGVYLLHVSYRGMTYSYKIEKL